MKKFLTMFAFAAAIVLGAFTLASCGGDDEEENVYKLVFELTTQSEEVKKSATFQFYATNLEKLNEDYHCPEDLANQIWYTCVGNQKGFQDDLDKAAKDLDDPTLTYSIKMLKNGQQWKFLTLKTKYIKTSIDF